LLVAGLVACSAGILPGCAHPDSRNETEPAPDPLGVATPEALFESGMRHSREGDFVRAEQYLSSAIARGYQDPKAVETLISVCLSGSRYRAALEHARPQLMRQPKNQALRYLVASLSYATGDLPSARTDVEQVLQQDSDHPGAHYLIALLLLEDGGPAESAAARTHFGRYLDLAPEGRYAMEARAKLKSLEAPVVSRKAR
jgi:predicted Zn-dependent protease